MTKKELFLVKGINGITLPLTLPANRYHAMTRKGFDMARQYLGGDLDRCVNLNITLRGQDVPKLLREVADYISLTTC